MSRPAAALIDAWGCAHALAEVSRVGRDRDRNDVAVLHASVSSVHAELVRVHGRWRLRDLGSRNGVELDGSRIHDEGIGGGEVVRLGEVAFYFWDAVLVTGDVPRGHGRTTQLRDHDARMIRAITRDGEVIELVQRAEDGVLRLGAASQVLGPLECAAVRLLLDRSHAAADPDHAYVAWHEIAHALAFRSIDADAENVRELIHRVRKKLRAGLIESKRGLGYRIAVRAAPPPDHASPSLPARRS